MPAKLSTQLPVQSKRRPSPYDLEGIDWPISQRQRPLSAIFFLFSAAWLLSPPYCLALLAACAEYWVESSLFPDLKGPNVVSLVGLVVALLGEAIRKTGIVTAGSSFTHHIRHHREQSHRLITGGIYR